MFIILFHEARCTQSVSCVSQLCFFMQDKIELNCRTLMLLLNLFHIFSIFISNLQPPAKYWQSTCGKKFILTSSKQQEAGESEVV